MKAKLVVEKNVPMPEPASAGRPRGSKYPVEELSEVGYSFMVPTTTMREELTVRSGALQVLARLQHSDPQRYSGWKIMSRQVEGGIRVWRVK